MSAPILLGLRLLAVVLLYAFVGLALYLMWRTLQNQVGLLAQKNRKPLQVILLDGEREQTIDIETEEAFIGRAPECQVYLDNTTVSARHARLFFRHGHWWVEDAGSRNGTLLNDIPVTMATILTDGDTLICGNAIINILLPG